MESSLEDDAAGEHVVRKKMGKFDFSKYDLKLLAAERSLDKLVKIWIKYCEYEDQREHSMSECISAMHGCTNCCNTILKAR